jgi:hypothetical protein
MRRVTFEFVADELFGCVDPVVLPAGSLEISELVAGMKDYDRISRIEHKIRKHLLMAMR